MHPPLKEENSIHNTTWMCLEDINMQVKYIRITKRPILYESTFMKYLECHAQSSNIETEVGMVVDEGE